MDLDELSCRFCLSTNETVGDSLFCRLSPAVLTELVVGLLCIEVHASDQFSRMCLDCEKKLNMMYKLMCDFRNADRLFKVLLKKYSASLKSNDQNPDIEMIYLQGLEDENILETKMVEDSMCDQTAEIVIKKETSASPVLITQDDPEDDYSFVDPPSNSDASVNSGDEEDLNFFHVNDQELGKSFIDDGDEEDDLSGTESVNGKRTRKQLLKKQVSDTKCFVCMNETVLEKTLEEHLKAHQLTLPYKCPDCLMQLNDLLEVNNHYQLHQFPFGCLYCEGTFSQQNDLNQHRMTCHGYLCNKCSKNFITVNAFKAHKCARRVVKLKSLNPFLRRLGTRLKLEPHDKICPSCAQKFNSNHQLANHLQSAHPHLTVPISMCDLCPKQWTSLEAAKRHRITHKKHDPSSSKVATNAITFMTTENLCWVCQITFQKDAELVKHMELNHPEHTKCLSQCNQCDKKFASDRRKDQHVYKVHTMAQTARHCCIFCGKKFNRSQTLLHHEKIHREGKVYRCGTCSEEFLFKNKYYEHKRNMHG